MAWQAEFSPKILQRGYDYFLEGAVGEFEISEDVVAAIVYGTQDYQVSFEIRGDTVKDLYCDCPYAESGNNCKHMAAALFTYEEMRGVPKNQDNAAPFPEKQKLAELVAAVDEQLVRDFLTVVLEKDDQLALIFRQNCSSETSAVDLIEFKMLVDEIIELHSDYDEFISYAESFDLAADLSEVLERNVSKMIEKNELSAAFELTSYIFKSADVDNLAIDDSGGAVGMVLDDCYAVWLELIKKADLATKRQMFNWFMGQIGEEVNADFLADYIEEVLEQAFFETEFLVKKLQLAEKMCNKAAETSGDYYQEYLLGKWAARQVELMERLEKTPEEITEVYQKYWYLSSVRKKYLASCLAKKDYQTAIRVLKESIQLDHEYSGLVQEYSIELKELYQKLGQKENYLKQLWQLLLHDTKGEVAIFLELKQLYPQEKWPEMRDKVFKELANTPEVAKLYQIEGCYQLLMAYVKKASFYEALNYTNDLKNHYPKELLDCYAKGISQLVEPVTNRKTYQKIAGYLREMRKIPGGALRTDELITKFKKNYPRRKAMIGEFEKVK